jgi:hypothetical protein
MNQRGSKKHILDVVKDLEFINKMNTILSLYGVTVSNNHKLQPKGASDESEKSLQTYINDNNLKTIFPNLNYFNFNSWWNPSGGKAPTWDMISLCQLNGKDALLLVEAKAHKCEFNKSKKRQIKENASKGSKNNHYNIETRISEACDYLNTKSKGFKISIDSHYQLSNRVAFAWKLNQLNVPVVLLYLGFTGDTYFKKDLFIDDSNWVEKFNEYINGVVPLDFINEMNSDFLFIQSSLPINK